MILKASGRALANSFSLCQFNMFHVFTMKMIFVGFGSLGIRAAGRESVGLVWPSPLVAIFGNDTLVRGGGSVDGPPRVRRRKSPIGVHRFDEECWDERGRYRGVDWDQDGRAMAGWRPESLVNRSEVNYAAYEALDGGEQSAAEFHAEIAEATRRSLQETRRPEARGCYAEETSVRPQRIGPFSSQESKNARPGGAESDEDLHRALEAFGLRGRGGAGRSQSTKAPGDIMQRAMEEAGIGTRGSVTSRTATDPSSLTQLTVPVAVPVAQVVEETRSVGKTGSEECSVSPARSPGGGRRSFYAVYKGTVPGVYRQWSVASIHVTGFKGNSYKGFDTLEGCGGVHEGCGVRCRRRRCTENPEPR